MLESQTKINDTSKKEKLPSWASYILNLGRLQKFFDVYKELEILSTNKDLDGIVEDYRLKYMPICWDIFYFSDIVIHLFTHI